jgi:hypothetical protein
MSSSSAFLGVRLSVAAVMLLVMWRHRANQREYDSLHLIGIDKR